MKHEFIKGSTAWPTWACSCGQAMYNCRTRASAKESHGVHVAAIEAREELTASLARWEGSPAQLFLDVENVADWAARDQDEVRQLADNDEDAREAVNNGKIVAELARAFRALLILDGWGPVKLTRAS